MSAPRIEPTGSPASEDAGPAAGSDDVAVGRVGPAHGMRGEVFVAPWTDQPDERFRSGAQLRTSGGATLTVESSRLHGGRLVVRFTGVDNRAAAEALRGIELLICASARPPLDDPDDFYDTDLVGLAAHLPDGRPLGPVREVVHATGGDYLVIDVDGRARLVPFVAAIVPEVNLAEGTVTVDPPEGLLEL